MILMRNLRKKDPGVFLSCRNILCVKKHNTAKKYNHVIIMAESYGGNKIAQGESR